MGTGCRCRVYDLARKMGASRAINVTRESLDDTMKELGMKEGFDVGLEMSGNATAFREMLRTMRHGGSIAILGIPPEETAIDWNQVLWRDGSTRARERLPRRRKPVENTSRRMKGIGCG